MSRFLLLFAFLLPLALPSLAFAFHERGHLWYVPCGDQYFSKADQTAAETAIAKAVKDKTATPKMVWEGEVKNPCGFADVINIASSIINGWIGAGVIVATMGFAYAGLLYITAAGSEEKIKHAHSIFVKVIIGFTLMLGAWLIAKAFETVFLSEAAKARSFLK